MDGSLNAIPINKLEHEAGVSLDRLAFAARLLAAVVANNGPIEVPFERLGEVAAYGYELMISDIPGGVRIDLIRRES